MQITDVAWDSIHRLTFLEVVYYCHRRGVPLTTDSADLRSRLAVDGGDTYFPPVAKDKLAAFVAEHGEVAQT